VDVIGRDGWEAVTVRKVAAGAGVHLALVNYHFGSKADLMIAALEAALEREIIPPIHETLAAGDPGRVIGALVRRTLQSDLPDSARRVFESALGAIAHDAALAARARPMLERLRVLLATVFERAVADGRPPADSDAQALAILFAAVLDGLAAQRIVDPSLPAERIARAAEQLLGDRSGEPPPKA
jgi:AcrR family transcriptional regulator